MHTNYTPLALGNCSYAIGRSNQASGGAIISGFLNNNQQSIQYGIIEDELKSFLKENLNLIEINDFDSLYNKFSKKWEAPGNVFLISELHQMLEGCGIEDIKYMSYLPNYFLCSSVIKEFVIPSNIIKFQFKAFYLCPNINKLIWDIKHLPCHDFWYGLLSDTHYNSLILEFPEIFYDRKKIKSLKKFLKGMDKHNIGLFPIHRSLLGKLQIKFKDRKKPIKII